MVDMIKGIKLNAADYYFMEKNKFGIHFDQVPTTSWVVEKLDPPPRLKYAIAKKVMFHCIAFFPYVIHFEQYREYLRQ
jgi:hypothetical protein